MTLNGMARNLFPKLDLPVQVCYYLVTNNTKENKMKKKVKIEACESCGRPKATEEMNAFKAVQEVMQYIRINDNSPYMVEELPLYEGKIS
jgi:hypothetical protein